MTVVSLVEKGWAGARRVSLVLAGAGVGTDHVIRGQLSREVRTFLTPYPCVRITGTPVSGYRWVVFARLAAGLGRGPAAVLVDNPRAQHWVGCWFPWLRQRVWLVLDGPQGEPILSHAGQARTPEQLVHVLGAAVKSP